MTPPTPTSPTSPTSPTPTTARHPRLPADCFYWAVLTVDLPRSVLERPGSPMARAVLDDAFAAHLPIDLARVAPAYAALPGGGVLACALPASALDDPTLADAITLAPLSLPACLDQPADPHTPEALNVLTGPHEPRVVTVARRRRSAVLTAAVAVLAAGVGVGFERRAGAARDDRRTADAAVAALLASPAARRANAATDPTDPASADLALERELARLRATRSRQATLGLADASDPLAAVLSRWPRDLKAQAQSVSAAPGQLGVGVQLPGHAEAEALAAALSKTPGWEAAQPQISANAKGVQMQLTFRPAKGGVP